RVNKLHPNVKVDDIEKFITDNYKTKSGRRELTGEEVARIKELISRQGLLEFRILANNRDDEAAIRAAQDFFTKAKPDARLKADLRVLALEGKPAPPPRNAQGGTTFPAAKDSTYSYSYVEMGPDERANLNLDNAAKNDPERNSLWKRVAEARDKGEPYPMP